MSRHNLIAKEKGMPERFSSFDVFRKSTRIAAGLLLVGGIALLAPSSRAQQQATPESKAVQKAVVKKTADDAKATKSNPVDQIMFDTPEAAVAALKAVVNSDNTADMMKLFGPGSDQLLSGDPVEDANDKADFAAAMALNTELQKDSDSHYTILVGNDNWPSPIPIVRQGDKWVFDTKGALEEILNRRVGNNELDAIETSRAYVLAQWEYFVNAYGDNDGLASYAQKFFSSPGAQDGLYWDTPEDTDPSPMGKLVAVARQEGYNSANKNNNGKTKKTSAGEEDAPYHGYYFKILTKQAVSAPGGKYNYIINGNMIAGFGLVAFPATWGNSGVMTFIVNQQGRVYQKNLGPDTDRIASAMTEYNPDPSWKRVDDDIVEADVEAAVATAPEATPDATPDPKSDTQPK
jgi:hypothetical protein